MSDKINQTDFPRITLKCKKCGNEFQVNVLRFKEGKRIICQICSNEFISELGTKFAQTLQDLYQIKYDLDKDNESFQFSFIYKSSQQQPPTPYSFTKE